MLGSGHTTGSRSRCAITTSRSRMVGRNESGKPRLDPSERFYGNEKNALREFPKRWLCQSLRKSAYFNMRALCDVSSGSRI